MREENERGEVVVRERAAVTLGGQCGGRGEAGDGERRRW